MTKTTKALEHLLLILQENDNKNGWRYVQSFISGSHHYINKIIRHNPKYYIFLLRLFRTNLLERVNKSDLSELEKNYLRNHIVALYRMNVKNKNNT